MMGAVVLTEWSEEPFAHPPVADGTGPFPHRPFLETWWEHIAGDDLLALISSDAGTLPLRVSNGKVMFCGDPDLTDYHSPLGATMATVEAAAEAFGGHEYSFDSLPDEAATSLIASLERGGADHALIEEDITAVIDLPETSEAWITGLRKKDRHELRRKRRNLAATIGDPHLEGRTDDDAVAAFAELHRSAGGAKGGFMTPQREAFFRDLAAQAGASVELLTAGEDVVAAAFGFARRDGYYLYNSAYAKSAAPTSPGIVLLSMMIEKLIAEGVPRLDLLKGDEPYKFRLGATRRQLYRIEGSFA